jgi:hypothetical protein
VGGYASGALGDSGSLGDATALAVSGDRAYVTFSNEDGVTPIGSLHMIDIRDPTNPLLLGVSELRAPATGIAAMGNYAYVAEAASIEFDDGTERGGLEIIDITNPPVLQRVASHPNSGWWAQAVTISGQRAYVTETASGPESGSRIEIIDIGNPANPQRLGAYNTSSTPNVRGVAASGNYVYLAA